MRDFFLPLCMFFTFNPCILFFLSLFFVFFPFLGEGEQDTLNCGMLFSEMFHFDLNLLLHIN